MNRHQKKADQLNGQMVAYFVAAILVWLTPLLFDTPASPLAFVVLAVFSFVQACFTARRADRGEA